MDGKPFLKPAGLRWIVVAAAAALTVGALGLFTYVTFQSPQKREDSLAVAGTQSDRGNQEITALGRLEPEGGVFKVAAPATFGTARVARMLVKEGSLIKAGQEIAVMDNSESVLASALQAEAEVREAESRLAQVQAGAKQGEIVAQQATIARLTEELRAETVNQEATVARRQSEVKNAQKEYERFEQLFREGAINESARDSKRLALETATAQLREAQATQYRQTASLRQQLEEARATLNRIAEVRPVDVQQARAQVQVAMANFQKAKAELDRSLVRSPIDGQVIKIHADPGEQVGNDGILDLGKTSQMYVVAEIYESDISRVRVGQRASITSSAFPGSISGSVDRVGLQIRKNDVLNTDPAANTDARVVEVKIRLDDSKLVAGLTNLQVKVAITP